MAPSCKMSTRLVVAMGLSATAEAQLPGATMQQAPMAGGNSLLNDMKTIQAGGMQQMPGQPMGAAGQMPQMQMPQARINLGGPGAPMGGFPGQQPAAMPAFGGGMPMQQPGMPMQQQAAAADAAVDLACLSGPAALGWQRAKVYFRAIYETEGASPLQVPPREFLVSILDGAMQELKAAEALSPKAADECGLGKLCLQLLTFATIEDPAALVQMFSGIEQIASPVLTMLLDVPWVATAQAGWPIFGLLGTINMRKGQMEQALNTLEVDGIADLPGQALQVELSQALQAADGNMLQQAGALYLARSEAVATQGSALAPLTALAAQAVGNPNPREKLMIIQALQDSFKQVVGSGAELDVALSTNWPLWGMIQLALEPFIAQ